MLSRVFKDIYPRFKTMRGYHVERKGGWDCHGLPVEIAVEKQLGLTSKAEIEAYGIAEFNAQCRESVFEFLEDWNALTERIGFWLDLDDAYRTLDATYVESVWWALQADLRQGPALRGPQGRARTARAAAPRCPRHEVALGYKDVDRPVASTSASRREPTARCRGRRAAGLDDDAVDAGLQRRRRRRPGPHLRPRAG